MIEEKSTENNDDLHNAQNKKNKPKKNRVFFNWFFSRYPIEEEVQDPAQKLLKNMRITSKSRYHAAIRLRNKSNFSFFTTTILSLGLILIPLLQNSDVNLNLRPAALNALQVFLAVAVLIYSVIIGTSQYDMKSALLTYCADNIKDMTRNLRLDINDAKTSGITIDLGDYHNKYREICNSSESHKTVDFIFARLELVEDYKITGLIRFLILMRGCFLYLISYFAPFAFISLEIMFISEMLGYSSILPPGFRYP